MYCQLICSPRLNFSEVNTLFTQLFFDGFFHELKSMFHRYTLNSLTVRKMVQQEICLKAQQ